MDTLPSGEPQVGGFRSALACSGFRFRARLGLVIPSAFLRPEVVAGRDRLCSDLRRGLEMIVLRNGSKAWTDTQPLRSVPSYGKVS